MSNYSTGNGCLMPLAIFCAVLFCLIYPFYDGFVDREIGDSDLREYVLTSSRSVPPWIDGDNNCHFQPVIKNDWILNSAAVYFKVEFNNKPTEEFTVELKNAKYFSLADPLVIKIPDDKIGYFKDPDKKIWYWNLNSANGHRKPIKIAKLIHEAFSEAIGKLETAAISFSRLFDRN